MRIRFTEEQLAGIRKDFQEHPRVFNVMVIAFLLLLAIVAWDAAKVVPYEELHVYEGVYEALGYVSGGRRKSEHWRLELDGMAFKINPVIGFDDDAFLQTVQKGDVLTIRRDDGSSPWIEEIKKGEEIIHSYEQSLAAYEENSWVWKSMLSVCTLFTVGAWLKFQYDMRKTKKKLRLRKAKKR